MKKLLFIGLALIILAFAMHFTACDDGGSSNENYSLYTGTDSSGDSILIYFEKINPTKAIALEGGDFYMIAYGTGPDDIGNIISVGTITVSSGTITFRPRAGYGVPTTTFTGTISGNRLSIESVAGTSIGDISANFTESSHNDTPMAPGFPTKPDDTTPPGGGGGGDDDDDDKDKDPADNDTDKDTSSNSSYTGKVVTFIEIDTQPEWKTTANTYLEGFPVSLDGTTKFKIIVSYSDGTIDTVTPTNLKDFPFKFEPPVYTNGEDHFIFLDNYRTEVSATPGPGNELKRPLSGGFTAITNISGPTFPSKTQTSLEDWYEDEYLFYPSGYTVEATYTGGSKKTIKLDGLKAEFDGTDTVEVTVGSYVVEIPVDNFYEVNAIVIETNPTPSLPAFFDDPRLLNTGKYAAEHWLGRLSGTKIKVDYKLTNKTRSRSLAEMYHNPDSTNALQLTFPTSATIMAGSKPQITLEYYGAPETLDITVYNKLASIAVAIKSGSTVKLIGGVTNPDNEDTFLGKKVVVSATYQIGDSTSKTAKRSEVWFDLNPVAAHTSNEAPLGGVPEATLYKPTLPDKALSAPNVHSDPLKGGILTAANEGTNDASVLFVSYGQSKSALIKVDVTGYP